MTRPTEDLTAPLRLSLEPRITYQGSQPPRYTWSVLSIDPPESSLSDHSISSIRGNQAKVWKGKLLANNFVPPLTEEGLDAGLYKSCFEAIKQQLEAELREMQSGWTGTSEIQWGLAEPKVEHVAESLLDRASAFWSSRGGPNTQATGISAPNATEKVSLLWSSAKETWAKTLFESFKHRPSEGVPRDFTLDVIKLIREGSEPADAVPTS
ncbi:hypothetical protein JCM24511_01301 [Saitozyma sp. JCM 24511]|nr:hypothetical protein JCM24511_01301 [Saitozyma sp. JCM 24511]